MNSISDLKEKVLTAVNSFLKEKQSKFLVHHVHEQSISHRIAIYLESLFTEYHVDCEYNKHGNVIENMEKLLGDVRNIRSECGCSGCEEWLRSHKKTKDVRVRPDIIVHKNRGSGGAGNVLVMEIKKNSRCSFDQGKLKTLTDKLGDYKYKLGVFLCFYKGEPRYRWFIDGAERHI